MVAFSPENTRNLHLDYQNERYFFFNCNSETVAFPAPPRTHSLVLSWLCLCVVDPIHNSQASQVGSDPLNIRRGHVLYSA
jgi:hypothetical protein